MKISIITVSYNAAATIRDTIESVMAQDHPDVEYIIVDGGSKDGTMDIVREYSDRMGKVVSERDQGIYDAMNKGVAMATGDVVGILNSDDFYTDGKVLSDVARLLESSGATCLIGDLVIVHPEHPDRIQRYYSSEGFSLSWFEHGDMPPHPTFFVRRELYERHGNFEKSYRITADYDLMLRMMHLGKEPWVRLPRVMVTMRGGGNSNNGLRSKIRLNQEIMHSLHKHGLRSGAFRVYSKYFRKVFQLFRRPKPTSGN
ncbi:MAG: glycosyltransferase family 2 protein [Bacteroidia bacterium]